MISNNYLVFNGVDTRNYGIVVTNKTVFDKPKRSYEFISVPGVTGDVAISNSRWANISIIYECNVTSVTDATIEAFTNAIMKGSDGYCKLEDGYDIGWYREAILEEGIDFNTTPLNKEAIFTITFNCNPIKFLSDWYKKIYLLGATYTYTGTYTDYKQYEKYVLYTDSDGVRRLEIPAFGLLDPDFDIKMLRQGGTTADIWVRFNGDDNEKITFKNGSTTDFSRQNIMKMYRSSGCLYGDVSTQDYKFDVEKFGISKVTGGRISHDGLTPKFPKARVKDGKIVVETNGNLEIRFKWGKL